jgi:hypothetical protein
MISAIFGTYRIIPCDAKTHTASPHAHVPFLALLLQAPLHSSYPVEWP